MGRLAAGILALVLAAAGCGGGDPVADALADPGGDLADARDDGTSLDLDEDGSGGDSPFDAAGHDVPLTCEALRKGWQCLLASDCGDGLECSGPEGCDLPPCWGDYCTDFPGACLPRTTGVACPSLVDCAAGQGCAGMAGDALGACRYLPDAPGACWTDEDCTGGQRCTGEVRCDASVLGACVDHPGLCLPPSASGRCLDDEECQDGWRCQGAVLCRVGDAACTDRAGDCVEVARAGCQQNADCQDDPDGRLCVGVSNARAGWCAPGPVLHDGECWEDSNCGPEEACRGAAPCPPGRRCRTGGQHAGFCMPFPGPDAPGIVISFTGDSQGDPEGLAVVRNGLPVAIVVPTCYALNLETAQDAQWPDTPLYTGYLDDVLCGPAVPLMRIPAGGTRTLKGLVVQTPIGTSYKRFVLEYRMGCDGLPPTSNCRVPTTRRAYSAGFQQ